MEIVYTVKKYSANDFDLWNNFISEAKNATFLFHRNFMEYHSDRFIDFSLLVFDKKNKLVAVLPANIVDDTVFSHQGLTYGGVIFLTNFKLKDTIAILKNILIFLYKLDIKKIFLKQLPLIYCENLLEEIGYLLHICKANTLMKHNISVINLKKTTSISRIRKRGIEKGILNNLVLKKETFIEDFWNNLLIPNLKNKYNSKPVHTIEEINSLMAKFPNNIHHYNVYKEDKLVAGMTVFVSKNVAKSQYISGTEFDNKYGSLDFMCQKIIDIYSKNKKHFDFGPSHINNGLQIVESLNYFKESFGSHYMVQDFYELETKNYYLLDTILI